MADLPVQLYLGPTFRRIRPVASASAPPTGWVDGPVIMLDYAGAEKSFGSGANATLIWLSGSGAAAAAKAVFGGGQGVTVISRASWLESLHDSALLQGVFTLSWWAMLLAGLIAALAFAATVAGGARERGVTLAMLRAMGLSVVQARWIAFGEIAPPVLTSLIAGIGIGVLTIWVLGPALGLILLTGGLVQPEMRLDVVPLVVAVLAGFGLLGVTVIVQGALLRRRNVSLVLRNGADR
jgi:putative ABC transport system permease protein